MRRLTQGFPGTLLWFTVAVLIACDSPRPQRTQDAGQAPAADTKQQITYSQDPNAAKNMTLLLKDFEPKSMLHAAEHLVPRAKFPVIDVHNHVNDPGGVHVEEIPAAEVVRRMDKANVQKIVILTGMWGQAAERVGQDGQAIPRSLHRFRTV